MRRDLLHQLLSPGQLVSRFQPIVRLNREHPEIVGFEALTGGARGTNFESAGVLFEYVRRKKMEPIVDRECIRLALDSSSVVGLDSLLSLNVHASTIVRDKRFAEYTARKAELAGRNPETIIIEVVEYLAVWAHGALEAGLRKFREYGMKIAVDDLGSGQSNYRMVLETKPDYLKIDGFIVRGCGSDTARQAILESIARLGERLGCAVVAEGIEYEADWHFVRDIGVTLAQGYLFGRPCAAADMAKGMSLNAGRVITPSPIKAAYSENLLQ